MLLETSKRIIIILASFHPQVMLRFLAIMIVAVVANYYVLLIIIPVLIVFWLLRLYYLKPAREIKRLEAICEQY